MKGKLYLIGGGEIRLGDTQLIDAEIMQLAELGATMTFFATAASDSKSYIQAIREVYGQRYTILTPTLKSGKKYAHSAIKQASVIYLGGGDADKLMDLFAKWQLEKTLRYAYENGTHVIGMSAGAQALSRFYFSSISMPNELQTGWAWLPMTTLVHAQHETVARAKTSLENTEENSKWPLIAIGEKTALRINGKKHDKIGSGPLWKQARPGAKLENIVA
ncbi:Type 1 glutamine amidotransferase-like domain-containing protein [Candidatus Nomurabacteria bacterium]|nr:Type 1 glutamine amidotransferase-like domain-containing protein [Candidatus Nomurabacteria bacterium]